MFSYPSIRSRLGHSVALCSGAWKASSLGYLFGVRVGAGYGYFCLQQLLSRRDETSEKYQSDRKNVGDVRFLGKREWYSPSLSGRRERVRFSIRARAQYLSNVLSNFAAYSVERVGECA